MVPSGREMFRGLMSMNGFDMMSLPRYSTVAPRSSRIFFWSARTDSKESAIAVISS